MQEKSGTVFLCRRVADGCICSEHEVLCYNTSLCTPSNAAASVSGTRGANIHS
jgi:hypothetical protein